jgi:hypothetical protein
MDFYGIEKDKEEKTILMQLDNWSIVKYRGVDGVIVYGEHEKECIVEYYEECRFSYEHGDKSPDGSDTCWLCGKEVPSDVVGLVKMYNWSEL